MSGADVILTVLLLFALIGGIVLIRCLCGIGKEAGHERGDETVADHYRRPVPGEDDEGGPVRRKQYAFDAEKVIDVRSLGGSEWRVVGMQFYLTDTERDRLTYGWTVLRRAPQNPHDKNAVEVYVECRLVGYLSAAKAKIYSPLLAKIGGQGVEVEPRPAGRKMYVTLPTQTALKKWITAGAPQS